MPPPPPRNYCLPDVISAKKSFSSLSTLLLRRVEAAAVRLAFEVKSSHTRTRYWKLFFFFLGRVSLWTTADPYSNPYAFTLLLFAGDSHHRLYCRCATHRSTFKLSAALPSRKAHFVLPKGRTHYHSAPVIWAGFH